jgi:uncharacterized protein DUF3574
MQRLMLHSLGAIAVTISMLVATPSVATAQLTVQSEGRTVLRRPIPPRAIAGSLDFARTELFFGTAKPVGVVTEDEFFDFVDQEVTPRFPDGLTVVRAEGQFRGGNGEVIKEDSFVLILLHPLEDFRENSRKINTIRRLYRMQFQQESVLRVDDPFAVRVSF